MISDIELLDYIYQTARMGHDGIDAVDGGIAIIDGGHYGLEHIFIDFMDTYIREQVDGNLEIVKAPIKFPASVL